MALEAVHLTSKAKKINLKNFNIQFPFYFPQNLLREPASAKRYGSVSFDRLSKNGVSLGKTKINFLNHNNALMMGSLHAPSFFGGELKIQNVKLQAFPSDAREVTLTANAKDIAYEQLSQFFSFPSWPGKMHLDIHSVIVTPNLLKLIGSIELLAWQGRIYLQDIEIEEPFALVPTLKVKSIDMNHIHLGELTNTFGFGIIDGGLEAHIENFAMIEGRPISFKIRAQSIPMKGSSQVISVDAIKNISKLGGDESSFVNDQLIYSFIKEFGYSHFGFEANLEGDTLQISPLYSKGDTHYLIQGSSFPPSVDIIYKNDLQTKIPLPELWERLKNIDWKKTVVK